MITHKFREVMALRRRGDRAAARAPGRRGRGRELDARRRMAEMMVGAREIPAGARHAPERRDRRRARRAWSSRTCVGRRRPGSSALRRVIARRPRRARSSGIAGVAGNGQAELVEVLAGQRAPGAGEIRVDGRQYRAPADEIRGHGVCCLPEEPLRNACVPAMSVAENMALRDFDRPPLARRAVAPRAARSASRPTR